MKTKFVKETDKKGRVYIIEGTEKGKGVFSIDRFVCEIQSQETEKETQDLADMVLNKLNS